MAGADSLADEALAGRAGELRAGRRVVIFGLVGRADLNDLEAVILPGGDRRESLEDLRLPVRTTLRDERVLIRPRNLTAAASLAIIGQDGMYACLLRLDPCSALLGRLVCTSWRLHLSRLLGNREWQAVHLPLPALCRATAWAAAKLRLDRVPGEARMSCVDWMECADVEARTGIAASGARRYPASVELLADAGNVPAVLGWLDGGGHVDARASAAPGYTLLQVASEVGKAPLVEALLARKAHVDLRSRSHGRLTALMIAAQGAESAIVGMLLKAGADAALRSDDGIGRPDDRGQDALQMAEEAGFEGMDDAAKAATVAALRSEQATRSRPPVGALRREPAFKPFVLATPDADSDDSGAHREPLLLALQKHAPASLVRSLVQHWDTVDGEAGTLPIGLAVSLGVSADVLAILCAADPRAVSSADEKEFTPLHHAALARDPAALRVLLHAAPAELTKASPGGSPLHLLARGPNAESKRLRAADDPTISAAAAAEACDVLLGAYADAEVRRATLLERANLAPYGLEAGRAVLGTPLHLAAEYHAPPALLLRLLTACPEAASQPDSEGLLPVHSVAGKHATDEMAQPLEALLAAHPPRPEWSLLELLKLGSTPGAEVATLARLAVHPDEAREMEPVPPMPAWDRAGSRHDVRRRTYRRYPLHHAAAFAAPRAVLVELLRLCPEAARRQTLVGEYPLHLAAKSAARLFRGVYGEMLRRPPPAETLCAAAAECVDVLLEAWPAGATACDKVDLPRGCTAREQRDGCGWWALHTALAFHAPEAVLEKLRARTPVDAFGNPTRPNPGLRGATKCNHSDMRRLLRSDDKRSCQLRFLCNGAEGAPPKLRWSAHNRWGVRHRHGRMALQMVASVDPSTQDVHSLEADRDDPDSEEDEEDGE